MAVINVRDGMYKEMDRILAMFDFEVSVNLVDDVDVDSVRARIEKMQGVETIEARTSVGAKRIKSDGTKGGEFGITGLPYDTPFSHPQVLSGRWLEGDDRRAIVLSSAFVRDNSDITAGSEIIFEVGNDIYNFEVVGIIAMAGDQRIGFSDFSTVARMKDKINSASNYLIKTAPNDAETQSRVANEVEEVLENSGIKLASRQTKNDIINSAASQFNFMIFFLLIMAFLVSFVGALGLAGTMSLNVIERTREIGVMRSIGANNKTIRKLVLVEGVFVGVMSFLLAIPLSLPLTYGFCYAIGNAFFDRTLVFSVVPFGIGIWFLIVVVISVVSSLIPARRASRISISETLSYE